MAKQKRQGAAASATQRLNVRLSIEAYRRLHVHSVYGGKAPGAILEDLIGTLKEFRVQRNPVGPAVSEVSASLEGGVEAEGQFAPSAA